MQVPDLSLLPTLDALLQEASVTAAARRMGLSTPAMSHALARIRERLGDPILVRAGRRMVLTPRAEALKPRVHTVVAEARQALEPARPFVAAELSSSFVVMATDYVLSVLGMLVDRTLSVASPLAKLRFVPNTSDDPATLRDGGAHLAIGIYGTLPQEMRSRVLLTDRFVVALREGHPAARGTRLSLNEYMQLRHVQIAPRGRPGGYVDGTLRRRGLIRQVARILPYFVPALILTARTDYALTVPERLARQVAPSLNLVLFEPPVPLAPYALSLVWHPRFDGDGAHAYLREAFLGAAREVAGDRHEAAKTRLGTEAGKGRRKSRTPRSPRPAP